MRKRLEGVPSRYPTGDTTVGDTTVGEATLRKPIEATMTRAADDGGRTELVMTASGAGAPGLVMGTMGRSYQGPPGAETTTEIPVLRPPRGGPRRRSPVELADGTVWYPGVSRRLSAPFALRALVWILAFFLLLGLAGLEVERVHPDWLAFLRHADTSATPAAEASATGARTSRASGTGASGIGASGTGASMRLISETALGSTYSVPARSYSVILTFSHPCWTTVASPAGSARYLVRQVLVPADSPRVIPLKASSTVQVAAQAESITVVSGHRRLGVIANPQILTNYNFLPAS